MSVGATASGAVASVPSPMGKMKRRAEEAANPAQQAAIAVSMKKAGKKPKNLKEGSVKQLIMDLRELKDKEFMKKYSKSKEEMKQGLKSQVDENMFDKITSFIGRPFDEKEIAKDLQNRGGQMNKSKSATSGGVAEGLDTTKFTDYDDWSDKVDALGAQKHMQKNGILIVAQTWDGDVVGEFDTRTNQGHLKNQGVAEGEVTRTKTGLIHKATDKYGAGEDPEGFNQKYARDLTALSKSEVKRLDNIHGVKWKNRGSKGVAESAILQGMIEARVTEDELLLMPGQGIKFKPELMPKKSDHEVEMARQQLIEIAQNAEVIYELIQGVSEMQGLDAWIQKKIVIADDYLESVSSYLKGRVEVDEQVVQPIPPKTSSNSPTVQPVTAATRPAPLAGGTTTQQAQPTQSTTQPTAPVAPQQGMQSQQKQPAGGYNTYTHTQRAYTNQDGVDNFGRRTATISTDMSGNQQVRAMDTTRELGDEMTINANIPKNVQVQMVPQQGNANLEETDKESTQEKLHRRHQELRKKSGLPDPEYYRELKATYDMPDDERWAKTRELKNKYKVKEQETDPYYIKDQQPQQQEPKQGMDVRKGLGLLSTIGRALNTVTSPTFGDDVKADIRTMIHNKVTGTPNK